MLTVFYTVTLPGATTSVYCEWHLKKTREIIPCTQITLFTDFGNPKGLFVLHEDKQRGHMIKSKL